MSFESSPTPLSLSMNTKLKWQNAINEMNDKRKKIMYIKKKNLKTIIKM